MTVADLMTRPVVTAREDETLADVAGRMWAVRVGCVVVVRADGRVAGILTAANFVPEEYRPPFARAIWRGLFGLSLADEPIHEVYDAVRSTRAGQVMRHPVVTVPEHASVDRAVRKMAVHGVAHLPVVRDGVPVGLFTRRELLRLLV